MRRYSCCSKRWGKDCLVTDEMLYSHLITWLIRCGSLTLAGCSSRWRPQRGVVLCPLRFGIWQLYYICTLWTADGHLLPSVNVISYQVVWSARLCSNCLNWADDCLWHNYLGVPKQRRINNSRILACINTSVTHNKAQGRNYWSATKEVREQLPWLLSLFISQSCQLPIQVNAAT